MTRQLVDGQGRSVRIGSSLGKGGEGEVFELVGSPQLVAKIYHNPPSTDKIAKLTAMEKLANPKLLQFASWPQARLIDRQTATLCGLIMPRISNSRPIHELYSPAHRKVHFPKADYRFLIRTARNCAAAFATLHGSGIVVGDVNQGNVLVNERALVTLIDCDSFQIRDGSSVYRCTVGVPHYTPPELQSQNLGQVLRTIEHDAFGLSVLIFHLLFLGRHPFSGRFRGNGDMPIEKAIAEYRFAFGRNASTSLMQPPPHSLGMAELPPRLGALFEAAFGKGTRRPAAQDWYQALEDFESNLKTCDDDPGHAFLSQLSACPFCRIVGSGGPNFFITVTVQAILKTGRPPDIDALWREINAILPPNQVLRTPVIPATPRPNVARSKTTKKGHVYLRRLLGSFAVFWAVVTLGLFIAQSPIAVVGIVATIGFGLWWAWENSNDPLRIQIREYRTRLATAQKQLQDAMSKHRLTVNAYQQKFDAEKQLLQEARQKIDQLPRQKAAALSSLQQSMRARQLQSYLESHYVEDANIPGVGVMRVGALQSCGIETAADVTQSAVENVPGFGPALTDRVVAWRLRLEHGFVYNPSKGIPRQDLQDLELQFAKQLIQGERFLKRGLRELKHSVQSAQQETELIRLEITRAATAIANAESLLASVQ